MAAKVDVAQTALLTHQISPAFSWPNTGGTWVNSYPYPATNVMWQTTSSNATYCSAASALSVT